MPIGLRIANCAPTIDQALLDRFKLLPTAIISDSMSRLSGGGARLRPIGNALMCGCALTVKTAPGDNLLAHKAIDMARPGDVIVIDGGGDLTNSIVGERMIRIAEHKRLGGLVINGAIRDLAELRLSAIPVFAAGVTHRGPYKNGPGEINYPIAIDGMVVVPGDIIVGDDDGLICISQKEALAVCVEAERRARDEQSNDPLTEARDWIDAKLRKLGCEFPPALDQVAAE